MPKTGGTSISEYFKKNGIKCGGGYGQHQPYLKHSIPQDAIIVTAIRCPVKRILSNYTSNLRPEYGPENPEKDSPKWMAMNHTFSEWLRLPKNPINWQSYVSWFGRGNDVGGAINNLSKIHYVLDTSHLSKQFNEQVVKKYGLPKFDAHSNKSRHPIDISKDDINFIRQKAAGDFAICKRFNIEISV